MFQTREVTMEVVALPNGRFAVQAIGSDTLDPIAGEFASRSEAEAWLLDRSMADDERAFDTGIVKPGDGQGVA
ncbi:MAG TPA: hypothetical protein VGV37_10085 [Aliidongia sp.]|uniref:hypothetical protein n=1 Tax=Aliidongia sp. TaxID=1914230 RepID=UPI002DDDB5B8|nr:hypothetical protein [Aliidongia sp.]HEV2674879.1 hypothetical protein [Aliidongia sp.]